MIKAPYNFVPLSDNVFTLENHWAEDIFQDIPFSDGKSGVIKVKITAETPIFVRNGHTEIDREKKNETYRSFCYKMIDGKRVYFIPATAIKGELRSIMEVLSFGKMSNIDDKRYGIRDLSLDDYSYNFTHDNIHCGWMTLNDTTVTISDRGIPFRVCHEDLDSKFNTRLVSNLSDDPKNYEEKNGKKIHRYVPKVKTTQNKYNFCQKINTRDSFAFTTYSIGGNNKVDQRIGVKFCEAKEVASVSGRIVLTGQTSERKPARLKPKKDRNGEFVRDNNGEIVQEKLKATGKFYEFVFSDKEVKQHQFDFWDDEIVKDFRFIYKDSTDWNQFFYPKLKRGEAIPVFFRIKTDGSISSVGLSYMYKLPFPKRVKDYLPTCHRKSAMDFAECIFGKIGNEPLRGRVQISNARCVEAVKYGEVNPYMASPKPTYYPIYLVQKGTNGYLEENPKAKPKFQYNTMLDNDAILKGRKFYPVRSIPSPFGQVPPNQESNTCPALPLGSGSVFEFTVHYHNLKPEELGLLLFCIQLRNGYSHSLGAFKPYGFGSCKYSIITNESSISEEDISLVQNQFLELMKSVVANYEKTESLKEFWAMHDSRNSTNLKAPLEYMPLPNFVDSKRNDAKKGKYPQYMVYYSELIEKKNIVPLAKNVETSAKVTCTYPEKQAILLESKNKKGFNLINNTRDKLKLGDEIKVRIMYGKSGNINGLEYIKKK